MASRTSKDAADQLVRYIDRMNDKHYSAEERMRTILTCLWGKFARARFMKPTQCISKKLLVALYPTEFGKSLNLPPQPKNHMISYVK